MFPFEVCYYPPSMAGLADSLQPSALAFFHNRSSALRWTIQLIASMGSAPTAPASASLVYRFTYA